MEETMVDHKPEKDQENKLIVPKIVPHEDIKNTRDPLVPNEKGDGASLEHWEESVLPPSQQNATTRNEYGFRLLDPTTKKVMRDWQWLSAPEAREHVIRQSMSSGQFLIERNERKV
jgi:hypothetical protein